MIADQKHANRHKTGWQLDHKHMSSIFMSSYIHKSNHGLLTSSFAAGMWGMPVGIQRTNNVACTKRWLDDSLGGCRSGAYSYLQLETVSSTTTFAENLFKNE